MMKAQKHRKTVGRDVCINECLLTQNPTNQDS